MRSWEAMRDKSPLLPEPEEAPLPPEPEQPAIPIAVAAAAVAARKFLRVMRLIAYPFHSAGLETEQGQLSHP